MPKRSNSNESEVLTIDCSDLFGRNLARILAFLAPMWALIMPTCFTLSFLSSDAFYGSSDPWHMIGNVGLLVTPLFLLLSLSLARKNLKISDSCIKFPGLNFFSYRLDDLKELRLEKGLLCFCFQDQNNNYDRVRLSLSRISPNDRIRLLQFLEEKKAGLLTSAEKREIENFGSVNTDPEGLAFVEIPYDGRLRFRDFLSILCSYERKIWTFWGAVWSLMLLLDVSLVQTIINHQELSPPVKLVTGLFNDTGSGIANAVTNNSVLAVFLVVFAVVIVLAFTQSLLLPNMVRLDKQGISLLCRIFGFNLWKYSCIWGALNRVELSKDSESKRRILFRQRNDSAFPSLNKLSAINFSLAAIKPEHRLLLKNCISAWAPEIEMEAGFLETSELAVKQSYTELWLQSLASPPQRSRLLPLKEGDLLCSGRYRILSILGSGGQGVAYLAEPLQAAGKEPCNVVIKEFILPVYVNRKSRQQAVERFENESRLLSALKHENIVQLLDHFMEDHRAYLVLEQVKGLSLRKLVEKEGALTEKQVESIGRQLCQILSYLHGLIPPLVHRDFTPDNLILDQSGQIKLIDFNVAQQNLDMKTAAVVGKHAYMPPEQFAGRACPQSDIYALGATLYFLLSGADPVPFCQSGAPSLKEGSQESWQALISSCTALDLQERAASADEIIAILNQNEGIKLDLLVKESQA